MTLAENFKMMLQSLDQDKEFTVQELQEQIDILKDEVDIMPKFEIKVVNSLPTIGEKTTIYLVRDESGVSGNLYDEYIYTNRKWEKLGSQTLNLDSYLDSHKTIVGLFDPIYYENWLCKTFTYSRCIGELNKIKEGEPFLFEVNHDVEGFIRLEYSKQDSYSASINIQETSETSGMKKGDIVLGYITGVNRSGQSYYFYAKATSIIGNKSDSNIESSIGEGSLQQLFDGSSTLNFNGKNIYITSSVQIDEIDLSNILKGGRGNYSTSLGGKSVAKGKRSVAEGTTTIAVGNYSHVEGDNSVTFGSSAHAEGYSTFAYGASSHSEGTGTKAEGAYSHAEGNLTIASGNNSHTEGYKTYATNDQAHAEGCYTLAYGPNSHVQGKYNRGDNSSIYADIVGNGRDHDHRSNAFALTWEGTGRYAGDVYTNCGEDSTGGKKLATEEYVNNHNTLPSYPTSSGNYVLRCTVDSYGNQSLYWKSV